MSRARLLLSLLVLIVLAAGLLPAGLQAQDTVPPQDGARRVVRVAYGSTAALQDLAARLDVWEVNRQDAALVALVTPAEEELLRAQGFPVEVTRILDEGSEGPLDPRYYYFDEDYPNSNELYVVDFLHAISDTYPSLVELIDIGDAWEASHGGHHRDLWVLRISNEDPAYGEPSQKPPFIFHAEIHAREVTTPELAIRYIKYLTSGYDGLGGYGLDPDVTWLVDWHVVYVEVMANPDGHRVNEQDIDAYRRKNMDNDDGCGDPDSWGVDLNRNHSFLWGCCGGSSGNPCSETYRGPLRASEPETTAFQDFVMQVVPDQNGPNGDDEVPDPAPITTTGFLISLHSYADEILWPWGWTDDPAPNGAGLESLARKMADINPNYYPSGALYTVDGATRDWSYGKLGIPSYVFEVGPNYGTCGGFFPSYDCQDGINNAPRNFWAENRPVFVYAHKVTRNPYTAVYGPDAYGLAVSPDPVQPGQPVTLLATLHDQRYSSDPLDNIGGAEYFIDAPGDDGTGEPMLPDDGSWGENPELAVATVDTSALAPGLHYILVHGKTVNDEWGPFTAVFLTVEPGQCDAVQILDVFTETAGVVVTFTASLSGTAPFEYLWEFPYGTSTEPTATANFGLTGTHPYTLTASNCWGTGQDTYHGTVSVVGCDPVQGGAFVWAPAEPIVGQEVAFTGTASSVLPIAFAWDFGDGAIGSGAVISHSYAADGDYLVTMTATNACSQAVVTDTIPVCAPAAAPSFSWEPIPPTAGEVVTFTGTASGSLPLDFAWTFGDGGSGSGATVSHTYTDGGVYTVTMTATNACGTQAVAQAVDVCTPVQGTDFWWSPVPPIVNEWVYFHGSASGSDPIDYAWDFGDGSNGSGPNPSHRYTSADVFTVVLTATNCGDSTDVAIQTVSVAPVGCDTPVQITGVVTAVNGCQVAFDSQVTGDGPFEYLWDFGDGGTSSAADPVHTYAHSGTYAVTLDAWNCGRLYHAQHALTVTVTCMVQPWSVYLPILLVRAGP